MLCPKKQRSASMQKTPSMYAEQGSSLKKHLTTLASMLPAPLPWMPGCQQEASHIACCREVQDT